MKLEELANDYQTSFAELTEQKNLVELKLHKLNEKFCRNLTEFTGKCFDATTTSNRYALTKQSNCYGTWIEKLHKVCQIIGTDGSLFIIQEYQEKVNDVLPRKRLTFDCRIYSISLSDFISIYKKEVSLSTYLETIKEMQHRDSYSCWHTSIILK